MSEYYDYPSDSQKGSQIEVTGRGLEIHAHLAN